MDILLEIILEIYLNLFEIIIPDHKFKKWQETLLKLACALVSVIILTGIIGGSFILADGGNKILGIVFLSVGSVLLVAQVVLFSISLKYQIKKDKQKNSTENEV